jgi:lysine 2,3-aminomutase
MKFLTDHEWVGAVLEVVEHGRSMFKDVCIHTHFNHPNEITSFAERAMHVLHERGVFVRNQAVLLRGVNDDAETLKALIKGLGRLNIHPYYLYLCDMVKGTEHFRLPLATARQLEKEVRGATAGFNTPTFVVDTPGGKRDVHSAEFQESKYGVAVFASPAVANGNRFYYFDPIRSLSDAGAIAWAAPDAREAIIARVAAQMQQSADASIVNPGSTSLQPLSIVYRGEGSAEESVQSPLSDAA